MLVTTHSPYVLSKLNNLLKAGSLGSRLSKSKRSKLTGIIDRSAWLSPVSTSAYAIHDRRTWNILGEDGLIDGDYLDSISSELSDEFSAMLDLEYGKNGS
jgi:hypothetical protein